MDVGHRYTPLLGDGLHRGLCADWIELYVAVQQDRGDQAQRSPAVVGVDRMLLRRAPADELESLDTLTRRPHSAPRRAARPAARSDVVRAGLANLPSCRGPVWR